MYQIRKIFKFEGSHALHSAYSQECMLLHGHSYRVEVFLKSDELNEDEMVVDFKLLKEKVQYIFDAWDHACVISEKDVYGRLSAIEEFALVVPFNPTAENMAKYFYDKCKEHFPELSKVRVHETATGYAEYFTS